MIVLLIYFVHIFSLIINKSRLECCLGDISEWFELGHVGLDTRLQCQISGIFYDLFTGHILNSDIIIFGHIFYKNLLIFQMDNLGSKTRPLAYFN